MKKIILSLILLLFVFSIGWAQTKIVAPDLGRAASSTILAGSEINNSSNTEIEGNVGVYSGTVFTGSATVNIINGIPAIGTAMARDAQLDLAQAYQDIATRPSETGKNLTGQNLGGKTLKPGVYTFNGPASLDGTLTLDNNSDPTAVFIFQVKGDLTLGTSAVVSMLKDYAPRITNVFWQVQGAANLGAFSLFKGTLMAQQSVTAGSRVGVEGRLQSINGAVNLAGNTITIPADLAVTKTKTPGAVRPDDYTVGEQITFTITAINNGPINKSKIRVVDNLPAGLSLISAIPEVGTFDVATSTWDIPYLANKASAALRIIASATSVASQRLVTYSVIEIDEKEEISDNNNTGTISLCIIPDKVGAVTGPRSICVNPENAGKEYTYSVAPVSGARYYNWVTPAGWIFKSTRNTNTITVAVPVGGSGGKLSVTAGSTCGESEASEIIITASTTPSPAPGPITSTKNAINPCAGEKSKVYSIDPVNGAESYIWTFPSDWEVTAGANTTSVTVTIGKAGGEIKVIALNSCGVSLPSALAVSPSLTPPDTGFIIAGGANPCINENNTFSIDPVNGATAYTWEVSATMQIVSGQGTRTLIVKPLNQTTGIITAKAINGCGETTATLAINPVAKISTGQIAGNIAPCLNNKVIYSIDPVPGANSYRWTVTPVLSFTGQGTTSVSITPTTVEPISIRVEAVFSCGPNTARLLEVSPLARPTQPATITTNKARPCLNKSITFTIPAVTGATSYVWSAGTWPIADGQGTSSITVTAASAETTISVKALNACGESEARTLVVNSASEAPGTPFTIKGTMAPCVGSVSTIYLVDAVENATTYNWTLPNNTWEILEGTGTTTIKVKVGTGGGYIAVRAANDCGNSNASILLVSPANTIPATPGTISGSIAQPCISGKNISYSIDAVPGATDYEWKVTGNGWKMVAGTGTTAITVDAGTGPATIEVKAINGCGSGAASSLVVTPITAEPAAPVKITGPLAPCVNQRNLSYSIDTVAGASGYAWFVTGDWRIISGQNSTAIMVNAGSGLGTISVIALNDCGQSSAQSITINPTVTIPGDPGIISGSKTVCVGQTNVVYAVKQLAGVESYDWIMPAGWRIISGDKTSRVVVEVGSGAGKIKVTAKNGCGQVSSEIEVVPTQSAPASPGIIKASLPFYCAGETTLVFTVSPVARAEEYTWILPVGWIITSGQGTNRITVTANSAAGTINLEVKNNCGSSTASLDVVPQNKPAKPVISGNTMPCVNSTGNIYSVAPVADAIGYTWEVPAGWKIIAGATTPTIQVEAGNIPGNISVKVSNACGESEATMLYLNPATRSPENLGKITGNDVVCYGIKSLTYTVPSLTNASHYMWSLPTGWKFISGENTNTITVLPNSNPGVVTVMAENGCGKSNVSFLAVQITGQLPVKPGAIVTPDLKVCAGSANVPFTIGAVSGATVYEWEVPAGWVITEGQGTTAIKVTVASGTGTIAVKAKNGCGEGEAQTMAITAIATPEKPIAVMGKATQCAGNTAVYEVKATEGVTEYFWEVPTGWQIIGKATSNQITVKVGNSSGNIRVQAKNTCGASTFATLEVKAFSVPSPTPGQITAGTNLVVCTNQENISYSIAAMAAAEYYVWSVPPGWKIMTGDSTTSIKVKAGSQGGVISVLAGNACGVSTASTLAVTVAPTVSLAIGAVRGQSSVCSGQSGLIYSVPAVSGAATYDWTVPDGWEIISGKNTPAITVKTGLRGGQVTVVAKNACTASVAAVLSVSTQVTPLAPAQIKDLSSTCAGLSYSVAAPEEGILYSWTLPGNWTVTKGAGTSRINVAAPAGSKPGNITVTAANASGCSSSSTTMEVDPARGETDLIIANVFSPNNDGVNDKWEVTNIQNYPENDLVIINRWGNEVYRRKGYLNSWDGGDLSAGTYFYVLRVTDCERNITTHKGYVMIMR